MSQLAHPCPKVSIKERPSARVASVDCSGVMPLKLSAFLRTGCSAVAALLLTGAPGAAQRPCPAVTDSVLHAGWGAYRTDSIAKAEEQFGLARRLCPENLDASVGLGFVLLRGGKPKEADGLFTSVLARDSTNSDAWEGRTRSNLRLGNTARAVTAGRQTLRFSPRNEEIRTLLNRIAPDWDRGGPSQQARAATLQLIAR